MNLKLLLSIAIVLTTMVIAPVSTNAAVGQTCGGFPNMLCGIGEFCQKPAGRCGVIDISGKCAAIPQVCPKHIKRVCGCDGKTYNNDCERQMAMVSKNHDGRCKK